jgi:hypothetical protein
LIVEGRGSPIQTLELFAMAIPDFVPLLPVVVPSVAFAVERLVKHMLEYRKRVLDYYLECYVVAEEGSPGLLDLAELERARRHKRRRWQLPGPRNEDGSSPPRSLPP